MPTTVPSSVATTSDQGATAAGSGVVHEMTFAPSSPSPIPSIAPRVLSVALSTRNWRRMSFRRAPSDFRTPISRVVGGRVVMNVMLVAVADDEADCRQRGAGDRHDALRL